jgi:hypothetical protein
MYRELTSEAPSNAKGLFESGDFWPFKPLCAADLAMGLSPLIRH